MNIKCKLARSGAIIGLLLVTLFLCGCGGTGYSGGLINGIVHEGVYEQCGSNYSQAQVEGKRTTIDGVEITLPVDYTYGKSQQSDYNGANWQGDDAVRGVGLFSVEDGDGSESFKTQYSVNMRWCYAHFTTITSGKYPQHASYKAHSDRLGIDVGGTDAGGSNISTTGDEDVTEHDLLQKARILLYSPDTGKSCVCMPGFYKEEGGDYEPNWGGSPLALEFGVSPVVKDTLNATQNATILEAYFVDQDTPLGEYADFDGSSAKGSTGSGNICLQRSGSIDASSVADLAVSCAYDDTSDSTAKFNGHERVYYAAGSNGSDEQLPSTNLAKELRKLATNGKNDRSADCGFFVASVVRTALDKNFPEGGTGDILSYCGSSSKWIKVGEMTPNDAVSQGILQPGDVFVVNDGTHHHTMLYTGNEAILKQFGIEVDGGYLTDKDYDFVGANQDVHGPTIQKHSSQMQVQFSIFRFSGIPEPIATEEEIKNLMS